MTPLLNDSRGAVKKRAIRALGSLVACSSEATFTTLFNDNALPALSSAGDAEQLKTGITLISTLAASSSRRTGKRVSEILPHILKATTSEDEETKEVALQCLETLLLKCPSETTPSMNDIINASAELIKYDPNYAAADDDMDEDEQDADEDEDADEEDEDDFEEVYDDDDDTSWKVRRGAVKVLQMAIQTRLELLSLFYKTVAPTLISRFGEREETVRLEVWNTYTSLLRQTYVWGGNAISVSPVPGEESMPSSRPDSPAINVSLKRKRDALQKQADDS